MPEVKKIATTTGLLAIVLGIGSTTLSREFDSFVKGLFLGAGIALIVLGVLVISTRSKLAKPDVEGGSWLPSRDGVE